MPLKLIAPVYKTFTLERSDERYGNDGEPTTVTIRQATQAQHEQRQSLWDTIERKFSDLNPDEVTLVQHVPMEVLKRLEVYLTLADCNITTESGDPMFPSRQDKDGNPKIALSKAKFEEAWGLLPPDVAEEIHQKVLDVNIIWSGRRGEVS